MAGLNFAALQGAIFNMLSGRTARYRLIPATTGVPAVGAVSTTQAGAWAAAYTALAALNAITTDFWIVGFYLDTAGALQIFEAQVTDATPTVLSEFRVDLTAVTPNLGLIPAGAFPIYMAANALVQWRAGGAAAKVLGCSMLYAITLA